MRIVIYVLMALALTVVQMAVLPYIMIHGGSPDLAAVFIVTIGLLYGPTEGATAGLVLGLVPDLVVGRDVGVGALVGMAAGYASGRFAFLRGEALSFVAFFGSAAAAYALQVVGLIVLRAAGGAVMLPALFPHLSALAQSAVLGPVVLAVLDGRVGRRRDRQERVRHRGEGVSGVRL
jgi:rod shape-determining protein MreD